MTDAAPPAPDAALTLAPPAVVAAVAPTRATALAPGLDPREVPALDAHADALLARLLASDPRSPDARAALRDARRLGDDDVRAATERSAATLAATSQAPATGTSAARALEHLRATVASLDPTAHRVGRRWFGIVPVGDSTARYFRRYEDAQAELDAVITGLYDSQDALRRQNALLGIEQEQLAETMARLARWVHVAARLEAGIVAAVPTAPATSAGSVATDALHAVRTRHQDLLVHLAVCVQAHLAVATVIRTNAELVIGIERATTTTVVALRTAVLTAGALAHRELVLDRVAALDTAAHAAGAGGTAAGIDRLQEALSDVVETLDALGEFQGAAAASLGTTLSTLATAVDRTGGER